MFIRLTKEGLNVQEILGQHVWPLKVTATVIDQSMPSAAIFVYHAAMDDDAYVGDVFECVASLQQYNDLPENAAAVEDGDYVVPYFRSNTINFHCRSALEAEELWADIVVDVRSLIDNYVAFTTNTTTEIIEI